MVNSLLALRHSKSPTRPVSKAILVHTRDSRAYPDYRFVNNQLIATDMNVRSLANKSAAVHETIVAHSASRGISATAELLVLKNQTNDY